MKLPTFETKTISLIKIDNDDFVDITVQSLGDLSYLAWFSGKIKYWL